MVIPGPRSPTGSSPDFASGPIIPNAIFPLTLHGETFTDGAFNDVVADITVPDINQFPGFDDLDGHSHIPFFIADNFDFASLKVPGNYEYRISLLDAQGNGFRIVAPFQVVPEPSSWLTLATACLILTGLMCYRRWPAR